MESNLFETIERDLPHLDSARIRAKIRWLIDKFKAIGAHLLTPCTHDQQASPRPCWIAWHLPEINEFLWKIRMEITEHTPGAFTLSGFRGWYEARDPDNVLLEGVMLSYLLLTRHTCVKRLQLETEPVLVFRFPHLLSKALERNEGLVEARIGYDYKYALCELDPPAGVPAVVSTAVANLSARLESLDLTNPDLDEEAMTSIIGAMRGQKLRHLGFHNSVSRRFMRVLFRALRAPSNLTSLKFDGDSKFSRDCAVHLASALTHNKTLRKLSIDGSGQDVAAIVIGALKDNDSLEELSLHDSFTASSSSFQDGVQALHTNKRLRYLKLSHVSLWDCDAAAIADVLTKNSTIEELCLPTNQISTDGAGALAKALLRNSSLRRLDLSGNRLFWECVSLFLEALSRNTTPECVRLGEVSIPEDWTPPSPLTAHLCARLHVMWNTIGIEQWAAGIREGIQPFPALWVSWMSDVASSRLVQFFNAMAFATITELTVNFMRDNIRLVCTEAVSSLLQTTKTLKKLVVNGIS
ncbi:hypothetical protein V5799_033686, partial [Amblyomma americanum]